MKKNLVLASVIALLILSSCTTKKEEKEEVVKFTTTKAIVMDTISTKEYVSQINSIKILKLGLKRKAFCRTFMLTKVSL